MGLDIKHHKDLKDMGAKVQYVFEEFDGRRPRAVEKAPVD